MLARFDWNQTLGFMKLFGHYDCGGHGAGRDRHGRQKPTISVAGYLATAGQWYEHHRLWRKRLKVDGFSEFHMTDFMANSKDFQKCKTWSDDQKITFLNDLISIIVNNVTFAIGMAVHRADYDKVLKEEPEAIHNALASPYAFCAFRCIESGADWSNKHRSRETINYIFEQGDPHAKQLCQTYSFLCEFEAVRRRLRLGSFTFEPKGNTSLEAADLITWALNRELYHQLYPEPEYEFIRPTLTNFLASVDNMYKGYYEKDLRSYLRDLMDKKTRDRNKKKGRFVIINVPDSIRQPLLDELKAKLEKGDSNEKTKRISKVRRNNARTVSRSAKRTTKGTGKRRASKSAKKEAAG